MSTHSVKVWKIDKIYPHPNADALEIIRPLGGFQTIIRKGDWKEGDLGAFLPPDSIVDTNRAEFSFLAPKAKEGGTYRIRVVRLRGEISMGLFVPVPTNLAEGDDAMETLGVEAFSGDTLFKSGGNQEAAPPGRYPLYDVENLRAAPDMFEPGEPVMVTEKIHGANARYVYINGRFWAGSRRQWKQLSTESPWWQALAREVTICHYLQDNEGVAIYGEIYGFNKGFDYGTARGEVRFCAFDILFPTGWISALDFHAICRFHCIPHVPLIATKMPYDLEKLINMAETNSFLGEHLAEGIVIKPIEERWHHEHGRVMGKLVSNRYHLGEK